jgi:hypothetical protein
MLIDVDNYCIIFIHYMKNNLCGQMQCMAFLGKFIFIGNNDKKKTNGLSRGLFLQFFAVRQAHVRYNQASDGIIQKGRALYWISR